MVAENPCKVQYSNCGALDDMNTEPELRRQICRTQVTPYLQDIEPFCGSREPVQGALEHLWRNCAPAQGAGKGEETKEAKMGAVQVRAVKDPPRPQLCGYNIGIHLLPYFIPSGNPTVLFSVEILCPMSSRKIDVFTKSYNNC